MWQVIRAIHKWSQNVQEEKDWCRRKAVSRKMGRWIHVYASRRKTSMSFALSVVKEYNIRWHFDTKHGAKYAKVSLQEKQQKVKELKDKLWWQQNVFTKAKAKNDAAVRASLWLNKSPALQHAFRRERFWSSACWRCVCRCAPTRYRLFKMSVCQETPWRTESQS